MIFLDFDGVLFDTVNEAYAVSTISKGLYDSINKINFESEHFIKFKKLRYLISPAWNYKYLLDVLESQNSFKSMINTFLQNTSVAKKKDYLEFENNFFQTRKILMEKSYDHWLQLNKAYPFLNKIKFLFQENIETIYIITTKDKASVSKLLLLEGIEFDKSKIFDKSDFAKFKSKRNIIESLIDNNSHNIFIDDSRDHLEKCNFIKYLKCIQPNWGYIAPSDNAFNMDNVILEINKCIETNKCIN